MRGAANDRGGLDPIVSKFLKENRSLGDEGRAFVVDAAQGMLRVRFRLEAAARTLDYEPTRAALVGLFLVGARGTDPHELPFDVRGAPALIAAWQKTDAMPLHVRASLPAWLAEKLGEELALSFSEKPPMTLRANTLKASRDDVIEALAREGFPSSPGGLSPDAIILDVRGNVFRTKAFHDGLFEVQDEGSQLVSRVCDVKPGMVVVDGCAGAGGKTLHLAALMEGKGTIHALDTSWHRLEALKDRARRAGAHNVRVERVEAGQKLDALRGALRGKADVILVDAPCSGTGVLRRNPDTSWRLTEDDVARLVVQQREILEGYAALVRPGGRLVYATCSLLRAENEDIVESVRGFEVDPVAALLQRQGIEVEGIGDVLHLDPVRHGTDGFFAAALLRADTET